VITSKLTSKAQTTIPQPVRQALRVREGDVFFAAI
jgi:antitoxin PrlF